MLTRKRLAAAAAIAITWAIVTLIAWAYAVGI